MKMPRTDIHLLRTVIINAITAGVAAGLFLNLRRNPDIPPGEWPDGEAAPRLEVIIPARNEERNIGPLLKSLMQQNYPAHRWYVTVVDDGSKDGTAAVVRDFANRSDHVRLVRADPLPEGWTGKNHAMWTGYTASEGEADYILFADADTRLHWGALSAIVRRAQDTRTDLLSLVIKVEMRTFWERVIVPQAGELYTLLVGTMDSVNSRRGTAAANGQFMLVRRDQYGKVGNLPHIRSDVAEDRAIASEIKASGGSVRLEYGRALVHARVYTSLAAMWEGYSKTLFWATGHNAPRALIVALALGLYAVLPVAALADAIVHPNRPGRGRALAFGVLQIAPMLAVRAWVCHKLDVPLWYAVTYPLAVTVGDAMLLFSVYRVISGRGVSWKGRIYR
jgi:chlorobactene glucosyltransferase